MREGTGADRQIARGQRTRDLKAVIDHIVSEIPGLDMKSRAARLISLKVSELWLKLRGPNRLFFLSLHSSPVMRNDDWPLLSIWRERSARTRRFRRTDQRR